MTCAVCWGDPSAYALLTQCRLMGIGVPDELAIVGFNGIEPPVEPVRVLTTVKAYWAAVAEKSVSILVDRIEGRSVPILTVLGTEFVAGDTT